MAEKWCLILCLLFVLISFVNSNGILCERGFCEKHLTTNRCATPSPHCRINNATHTGMSLPSPTICNCCEYCLPMYGEGESCSKGGPGLGIIAGRCGSGLTCVEDKDGATTCQRMKTDCHDAQDDYDKREVNGEIGALEHRPHCDDKGRFATFYCVPAHTCFCQSEDGKRIFGEAPNLGSVTAESMHCGCSRFNERIKKSITSTVPSPIVGPRCTSDGNFHPIQCLDRICHCVDPITGLIRPRVKSIDLDKDPISKLECYDKNQDLFPKYSEGEKPFYYTSPCLKSLQEKVDLLEQSLEDGFNVDFFNKIEGCYPDGTFGRIALTRRICVNERNQQIENYEALPSTPEFDSMNCNCALTTYIMGPSLEKPVCCKNGNFRKIQCRRGMCRCVDEDGRQVGTESADVTKLTSCHTADWRNC
ncbi:unnamed protein product [Chrysodeixis includens]|uniref:Thyroglobulin type-1 domain-containing protein n=1 Tax=Chrysodeixis includens TaxID=689277 RepID=A0A9N8Q1Y8_CHRIL|nr:unnamed protein product [Chrysodeixis includens]